ncbi:MAG TPA: DUF1800 domain-containing protein [Candidatus Acidoferrales bacterium]|nr:DUF1800 domain-containing protein [Candidatus Acidoferrales bacterium]
MLAPPSYAKPDVADKIVIPDTGLSEDEKIVHLLNRIGYGPRPGDVERVKRIGIAAYIEQQLNPESIVDEGVEQRLAGFETLKMKPQQLLAAYPPPQLLRQIDRRIGARQGMDPEAMEQAFPELQRMREREQRRQERGQASTTQGKNEDPEEREARRRAQFGPEERMREAMNGPQRIVLELSQAKILRAAYSERQLQEVMTDFWFNHFNVFIGKGADRWLTTSYEQEAIRPNALGKFRDLLGATARHPAMLFYLDNWLSSDPKADFDERDLRRRYLSQMQQQGMQPGGLVRDIYARRGLNPEQIDRYIERQRLAMNDDDPFNARRPMGQRGPQANARRPQQQQQQGRRRGLNENYARELMELHTLGVDGGYTQQDIIEVARCFTGWTLTPLPMGQQFIYVDELHDKGSKTVLGQTIKNSGQRDAERVLDIVARHPSTARFVATKLARRFVSDNPPASLVEKMAAAFTATDGDIRAVLRTVFSSEEFWAPEAVNAKVKTPLEFVVGAVRATDAEVAELPPGLVVAMRELGQPLYGAQPPTGYKDTADAWISTGALLNRMKVAMGLASNRLPGVQVELPRTPEETSSEQLVARLGAQLLSRPLPEATRKAIEAELARTSSGTPEGRTRLAMGWLLASPDFQRR